MAALLMEMADGEWFREGEGRGSMILRQRQRWPQLQKQLSDAFVVVARMMI